MVKTEPFSQWVIEDRFVAGPRPGFEEKVGARSSTISRPMKTRSSGCSTARIRRDRLSGRARGIEFVHEVVGRRRAAALVEALWDEAETTLPPPPGLDIAAYRAALLRRFADPALQHRNGQIAMDGSQKLPQRLLAVSRYGGRRGWEADARARRRRLDALAGRTDDAELRGRRSAGRGDGAPSG